MNQPIRVGVIHRNRLFRECLVAVLSDADRFQVVDLDYRDPHGLGSLEDAPPEVLLVELAAVKAESLGEPSRLG